MIPTHRVNQAYDTLNLPRDASIQDSRNRFNTLSKRYASTGESERLEQISEAFRVLEQADAALKAQRDMISNQTRSRSERELDGRLTEMAMKSGSLTARHGVLVEGAIKKQKLEDDHVVQEVKPEDTDERSTSYEDTKVFEKLNSLIKDESKYLRAVNVLFNMVKANLDNKQFNPQTLRMLFNSVDIATSSLASSDSQTCLSNLNDDNRKVITKVVNLVLNSEELRTRLTAENPELLRMWSHSVIFRNSLFELDNFVFIKKCKELISLVSAVNLPPQSDIEERWIKELLYTIQTICSKAVCKLIPGRFNDAKSAMTEIFKISRKIDFPQNFRDRVAELQKDIMSY